MGKCSAGLENDNAWKSLKEEIRSSFWYGTQPIIVNIKIRVLKFLDFIIFVNRVRLRL